MATAHMFFMFLLSTMKNSELSGAVKKTGFGHLKWINQISQNSDLADAFVNVAPKYSLLQFIIWKLERIKFPQQDFTNINSITLSCMI